MQYANFKGHICSPAVIECPILTDPLNGIVILNDNIPGETASYDCNPGYGLMGNTRRQCRIDGIWTGVEPTCEGMLMSTHLDLLIVEHGYHSGVWLQELSSFWVQILECHVHITHALCIGWHTCNIKYTVFIQTPTWEQKDTEEMLIEVNM